MGKRPPPHRPPDGARLATSPVNGFLRSKTAPPAAPTVSPPINILMSMASSRIAVKHGATRFALLQLSA
jgi:hypothetical protein